MQISMQFAAFWTQTCPTTLPMQFTAFLDANMPYYDAYTICSFFGRKHALLLCPCNLQLFWTHRYAENTKILEKWGGNLPKMTHISLQLQWKICTKWGNKPPKYDANSLDFGHKNLSFHMGLAGPIDPAACGKLTPSPEITVRSRRVGADPINSNPLFH